VLPVSDIGEVLAQALKRQRAKRGWTQSDLAEYSGYSLENIKKLETGTTWISREGIAKLAVAFKCSEHELFVDPAVEFMPSIEDSIRTLLHYLPLDKRARNSLVHEITEISPGKDQLLRKIPILNERQVSDLLRYLELDEKVHREIKAERAKRKDKDRKQG
jgi:transcriptional regulator with XRE-family HTH domain